MNNTKFQDVKIIEELSLNAYPAIQTKLYDGWVLRFTNGILYRCNSISPLYTSNIDYGEKIAVCENKYKSFGIPTAYRITENTDRELDLLLEKSSYKREIQINVMLCDTNKFNCENSDVVISREFNDKWLYGVFKDRSDTKRIETYKAIHENILSDVIYAYIENDGQLIAGGVGIIERGFVGLFDIGVNENYRQKGLGYKICSTILYEARKLGASKAYIEVNSTNYPAIGLYKKLGSVDMYKYWFRVKKIESN